MTIIRNVPLEVVQRKLCDVLSGTKRVRVDLEDVTLHPDGHFFNINIHFPDSSRSESNDFYKRLSGELKSLEGEHSGPLELGWPVVTVLRPSRTHHFIAVGHSDVSKLRQLHNALARYVGD